MDDEDCAGLPVELTIGAHIRRAAIEGIPIVVLRRGDPHSGAIMLKISRLDGSAHLLMQARMGDGVVWTAVGGADTLPEEEADRLLRDQADFDPDLWLIEIEDRQGRHWFSGKRLPP